MHTDPLTSTYLCTLSSWLIITPLEDLVLQENGLLKKKKKKKSILNHEFFSLGRRLRLGAWSTMADALITLPAPSDDVRVNVGMK